MTDNNKEEFPSLPEQGKNLAKFTMKVVKNVVDISSDSNTTKLLLPEEEWKERLDVCKKCDSVRTKLTRTGRFMRTFMRHKVGGFWRPL